MSRDSRSHRKTLTKTPSSSSSSSTSVAGCLRQSRAVVFVLLIVTPHTLAHPQCLDASPPAPASSPLTMCTQYSKFGCCSPQQEEELLEQYRAVEHRLSDTDWARCHGYVKDLLCQRCTPLAAHVYDAEGDSASHPRALPGMCADYCYEFYARCRVVVWFLDPSLASTENFQTNVSFCQQMRISDMGYCYPDFTYQANNSEPAALTPSSQPGCLCLESVATGLANPIIARHAGDGTGRLFVGEQRGVVHIVYPWTKERRPRPFLNITDKLLLSYHFGDERGLGGLAFHPDFARNGRVFVYYNAPLTAEERQELKGVLGGKWDHKVRLVEMRVLSGDPDTVDPDWEKVLLEVNKPFANHNGGEIFFLDDGYLYVFLGDGGSAGDPFNLAQNKSWLLGKVLRLDVDSPSEVPGRSYAIPPDNPFVHQGPDVRPEIFAFGVRNMWRCGVDMGDPHTGSGRGRVLCGDVGQSLYEEVDLLKKGANYGWRSREGYECYDKEMCNHIGLEELPVYAYNHSVGQSVTGGQFYRGCRSPALNGKYLYGDYQSRRLFSLEQMEERENKEWRNADITMCGENMCSEGLTNVVEHYILSFGQDQQGEVYMLSSVSSVADKEDGAVYRFVDPSSGKTDDNCRV